jgi:hypothetical protein
MMDQRRGGKVLHAIAKVSLYWEFQRAVLGWLSLKEFVRMHSY